MSTKIQIGTKVTAPNRIVRKKTYTSGLHATKCQAEWVRPSWASKEIKGFYIGKRTYQNGDITRYEDGHHFSANEWLNVALIVPDEFKNPIPVMYDEMTIDAED